MLNPFKLTPRESRYADLLHLSNVEIAKLTEQRNHVDVYICKAWKKIARTRTEAALVWNHFKRTGEVMTKWEAA